MTQSIIRRTPAETFDHWTAALLSGQYKQAQQVLRRTRATGSSFCCIGVACDLAEKDGGPKWDSNRYMASGGNMPRLMCSFLGITPRQNNHLIRLNDTLGYSFSQIAQVINDDIKPKALENLARRDAYNARRRAKRAAAKMVGV